MTTALTLPGSIATAYTLEVLKPFVMHELGPGIRAQIEGLVNSSVAANVSRALPGEVLPDGVSHSVRSVTVTPASIVVRGPVGAFGGVISKLPSSGGGSAPGSPFRCSYTALALSGSSRAAHGHRTLDPSTDPGPVKIATRYSECDVSRHIHCIS